jgi:hypothetical protein
MALWPWGRHSLLTEVSAMDPVKYCWAISRVQFSDDEDRMVLEIVVYSPLNHLLENNWCNPVAVKVLNYYRLSVGGKGGRCVRPTTMPPSCADFMKLWDIQPPGALGAYHYLYRESFTFTWHDFSNHVVEPGLSAWCMLTEGTWSKWMNSPLQPLVCVIRDYELVWCTELCV